MPDRSDIETTEASPEELRLVDLLYGELDESEAEEVRSEIAEDPELSKELESYQGLRDLLRELPDEEPPAAVTQQLLHAAADKAPSPAPGSAAAAAAAGGGLLDKILGFFRPLVSSPAIAAAAMFVLVAGVAGTLYVAGEFEVTESKIESQSEEPGADPPAAVGGEAAEKAGEADDKTLELRAQDGEGGYYDDLGGREATVAPTTPDEPVEGEPADEARAEPEPAQDPAPARKRRAKRRRDTSAGGGVAGTKGKAEPEPSTSSRSTKKDAPAKQPVGGVTGSAGDSPLVDADDDIAPSAPAEQPAPEAEEGLQEQEKANPAKELHDRAVQAAKDRECEAVVSLGHRIRTIDAEYYRKVYRTDKRLAACLSKQAPQVDTEE